MRRPAFIATHVLVLSTAACTAPGDDGGRTAAKLAQIEVTAHGGGVTTIERTELAYDGARLAQVQAFRNGAPNGSAQLVYGLDGLDHVDLIDGEGDRARRTFAFENGRLTRTSLVTSVSVRETAYHYDAANPDLPKEIAETATRAGETPSTKLTRFEYDAIEQLAKRTAIAGGGGRSGTEVTEYRYGADGSLERASRFEDSAHDETYTFRYGADDRLAEVTDTRATRHELAYDAEGRITEIRRTGSSGTTTIRYTYAGGELEALSFQPLVPMRELFDMAGMSYATSTGLSGDIDVGADLPAAPSGCSDCGPRTGTYRIENASSYAIAAIHLKECSSAMWGDDVLAGTSAPGFVVLMTVPVGCWDMKALAHDQAVTWTRAGARVTAGSTHTSTLDN